MRTPTRITLLTAAALLGCSPTPPPGDAGSTGDAAVLTDGGGREDTGYPDANATELPDLTVDADFLQSNAQFARMYFEPSACEIAEGCVGGAGWRTLLLFTTFTPNIGTADLNLGSNLTGGTMNPAFEYSTCHMHYHFSGYAEYSLLNGDGSVAALGHKQSFCVEDLAQIDTGPGISDTPHFGNCGDAGGEQGIQRGWADDYYPGLPCQWIDVTDVAPGDYTLSVAINYEHRFAELNYDNDSATASVTIPTSWDMGDPTRACTADDPDQGIGRECGWAREGVHTCTPGEPLSVGCNAGCGVGSCDETEAWNVRICRGDQNCTGADPVALVQQDFGECGSGTFDLNSYCGVARFECPTEGQYTVLVAEDQIYGRPADPLMGCHVAVVSGP